MKHAICASGLNDIRRFAKTRSLHLVGLVAACVGDKFAVTQFGESIGEYKACCADAALQQAFVGLVLKAGK